MRLARYGWQTVARYLQWRTERWSEERLQRHQRRRLARILAHVRQRSPYYRHRIPPGDIELSSVPRMTKSLMMEHFNEINTAQLDRDELVAFRISQERLGLTDLYPGGYAVGLSSGTSGNKVLTVLSARERAAYAALVWARSGIPGDLEERRVLFALRTNNPAFTAVTALGVELQYVDYFVPVDELVKLVNLHRLNVLAGPPSLLVLLAEQARRIEGPIEAVIVYAEEADATTKARLSDAFGAPVSEIYQGAEGMLGFTCREGRLHLSEDTALVELDTAGDTLGEARRVVVTDLYRRTQPFIRYELNDLIEVGDRSCSCGSAFRRIDRIHGRADSVFLLTGLGGGSVRLMPDYVRRSVNQASADIVEYQAIQLTPDEIEIRLDLVEGADTGAIRQAIIANLEHWSARAGGRIGTVRFSTAPPLRDPISHKLVRVVNRCR